jgi:hypothetical protein
MSWLYERLEFVSMPSQCRCDLKHPSRANMSCYIYLQEANAMGKGRDSE